MRKEKAQDILCGIIKEHKKMIQRIKKNKKIKKQCYFCRGTNIETFYTKNGTRIDFCNDCEKIICY